MSVVRTGHQMHAYLIEQVNHMIRRLGMFGGEPALWTTFEHLYHLEGDDNGRADLWQSWEERKEFRSTGLKGALAQLLPDKIVSDAVASMYAEAARSRGWLELDRTLTPGELGELNESIESFAADDHVWSEVVAAFGEPSVLIGGSNRYYGKTLAYATADAADPMVFFHLWNGTEPGTQHTWPPARLEPILLAIRYGAGMWPDAFVFTPQGNSLRRHLQADPTQTETSSRK
ncbi:hypothetical protein [Nocardia sp. NPDC051750]|uniref:hypothetical protein n=1 Tax=Nocardia sp. NPDC051750 TaxID=3364325 RepID=UPI0037B94084